MSTSSKPSPDIASPEARRNDRAIARLLLACAVLAAAFAGAVGWLLRDWSLGGFFLAVAVGAAALSAAFWPNADPPPH